MNIGLDTSVVLRLLVGEPKDQFEAAQQYLDQIFESGDQAVISDLVVSETYFALQYHYNVSKEDALSALRNVFEAGEIGSLGNARLVLENTDSLATARPGFVDRLIHAEYVTEGGRMATFEKKAGRLEDSVVLRASL